jgi:hypothetical protein
MKKAMLWLALSAIGTLSFAQKDNEYLMAWCSSKELKEVKLGCLSDAPMIISLENNDWTTKGYKLAFIDADGNKMIFTSHNGKAIAGLIEKAKAMRPVFIEVFDVIIGDKENAIIVDQKFKYPLVF